MSVSAVVDVLKAPAEIVPRSGSPRVDFAATVEVVEVEPRLAVSGALRVASGGTALTFEEGIFEVCKSSS